MHVHGTCTTAYCSICIHLIVTLTLGLSVWLCVDITSMLLHTLCLYLFYALSALFSSVVCQFDPEH